MRKIDLTTGNISKKLITIMIPVIGGSLMQAAYNLVDMLFLGRIGSDAVASAGTAGFYIWICVSVAFFAKIGTEIKVAHSSGEENHDKVVLYAKTGLQLGAIIGIIYFILIQIFKVPLIDFFNISSVKVVTDSLAYLNIVSYSFIFFILSFVFSGIFNGLGNTKATFLIVGSGVLLNIILDPIFIFYFDLKVYGAALATAIGNIVATIIFIVYTIKTTDILKYKNLISINFEKMKEIFKLSAPAAIQILIFAFISMIAARIIAEFGAAAIAVQRLGSQIESICWMVAVGAKTAIVAFVGQNYGAKKWHRLIRGYGISLKIMVAYGIIMSSFLFFAAEPIMGAFFISEPSTVQIGTEYLRILAFVQIIVIIEIITAGALNGLGKTKGPAALGLFSDIIRIPIIIIFSGTMGLAGIWWGMAITTVLKGTLIFILFIYEAHKSKDLELKYLFSGDIE